MWRDVAYLISNTESVNEVGDVVFADTQKEVFCNIKSISQKEFYQAQSTGFQPEIKIEMMHIDYSGEKTITVNTKKYNIIRTYIRPDEVIELTLSSLNERSD